NETKLRAQACLKPTLDLALTPESASLPLATHL
ncbi:MAG: hypothetical protein JWM33_1600, partial [Caulobacteraceae bacterium]|nr:hypothetical protein [Caulobacteraceae bacterium]